MSSKHQIFHMLNWTKENQFRRILTNFHGNQNLMTPSLLKIGLLCLCCVPLTGCVSASNWLAGSAQFHNSQFEKSHPLDSIQIGITTKEEILAKLGIPTDHQRHSIDEAQLESLSYSNTDATITPYQYLPLIGAIAFWGPDPTPTPSVAISFSSEKRVSGLTVSTFNAYGDNKAPIQIPLDDSPPLFYGMRNPEVSHAPTDFIHISR